MRAGGTRFGAERYRASEPPAGAGRPGEFPGKRVDEALSVRTGAVGLVLVAAMPRSRSRSWSCGEQRQQEKAERGEGVRPKLQRNARIRFRPLRSLGAGYAQRSRGRSRGPTRVRVLRLQLVEMCGTMFDEQEVSRSRVPCAMQSEPERAMSS